MWILDSNPLHLRLQISPPSVMLGQGLYLTNSRQGFSSQHKGLQPRIAWYSKVPKNPNFFHLELKISGTASYGYPTSTKGEAAILLNSQRDTKPKIIFR